MTLSRPTARRLAVAAVGAIAIMLMTLGGTHAGSDPSSPHSFRLAEASRTAGDAFRATTMVPIAHRRSVRSDPRAARSDVLREAARWLGRGNPTGTHGPWCADFVMFVLRRTGHVSIASRMARDAVAAGRPVAAPAVGAIMSTARHTGFVLRVLSARAVELLSGNHRHRVGIGLYSTRGAKFALPRAVRR